MRRRVREILHEQALLGVDGAGQTPCVCFYIEYGGSRRLGTLKTSTLHPRGFTLNVPAIALHITSVSLRPRGAASVLEGAQQAVHGAAHGVCVMPGP